MAPDEPRPGAGPDDEDLGPPIEALRALEHDTGDDFLYGIRRRIDRRLLAGDVVQLLWTNLAGILLEFVSGACGALGRRGRAPRKES